MNVIVTLIDVKPYSLQWEIVKKYPRCSLSLIDLVLLLLHCSSSNLFSIISEINIASLVTSKPVNSRLLYNLTFLMSV